MFDLFHVGHLAAIAQCVALENTILMILHIHLRCVCCCTYSPRDFAVPHQLRDRINIR